MRVTHWFLLASASAQDVGAVKKKRVILTLAKNDEKGFLLGFHNR